MNNNELSAKDFEKPQEQSTQRNLGVDLARVIAMAMVVICHMVGCGGMEVTQGTNAFSRLFLRFLACLTIGCVDLFAIISGYVGYKTKHNISSLIMLYLQVQVTNLLIVLGFSIYDGALAFPIKRMVLPVYGVVYWYFTAYFPLFFVMPLIDKGIEALSLKHTKLLAFTIVLLLPVCRFFTKGDPFRLSGGYSFMWLTMLYTLGAIFAHNKLKLSFKKGAIIYLSCIFLVWCEKNTLRSFHQIGAIFHGQDPLFDYCSTPIIIAVSALLLGCASLNIKSRFLQKLINFFNPAVFGVYLIHVHPLPWRRFWVGHFPFKNLSHFECLVAFLLIFVGLTGVEWLRILLFRKLKVKSFAMWVEKIIYNHI